MGTFYSPNCHYVYIVQENHWLMTNICWHMILVSKGMPLPFGKNHWICRAHILLCEDNQSSLPFISLPQSLLFSLSPSFLPFALLQ